MEPLQPLIERIGLNHHESTIYLYLLKNGEQPASVVAKDTKIPRSTTRGVLDKLCERGIISKLYKRNTQYYLCKAPTSLIRFVENQMAEAREHLSDLQNALPMLNALHDQRKVIPKVQFFEGKEGVIEAFNHSLYQEGIREILFFTSYRFLMDSNMKKNDVELYIPLRVEKGINLRVLVGKTERKDIVAGKDDAELRNRRFFPDRYELPGNFHIYGNFVAYFSASDEEYMATIVESSMMADTMRALFEYIWGQCS